MIVVSVICSVIAVVLSVLTIRINRRTAKLIRCQRIMRAGGDCICDRKES